MMEHACTRMFNPTHPPLIRVPAGSSSRLQLGLAIAQLVPHLRRRHLRGERRRCRWLIRSVSSLVRHTRVAPLLFNAPYHFVGLLARNQRRLRVLLCPILQVRHGHAFSVQPKQHSLHVKDTCMKRPLAPEKMPIVVIQRAAVPTRRVLARWASRVQLVRAARANQIQLGELPLQFSAALLERDRVPWAELQDFGLQRTAAHILGGKEGATRKSTPHPLRRLRP